MLLLHFLQRWLMYCCPLLLIQWNKWNQGNKYKYSIYVKTIFQRRKIQKPFNSSCTMNATVFKFVLISSSYIIQVRKQRFTKNMTAINIALNNGVLIRKHNPDYPMSRLPYFSSRKDLHSWGSAGEQKKKHNKKTKNKHTPYILSQATPRPWLN